VLGCLGFCLTLLLSGVFATRTVAHINDLSLAEIEVSAEKAVVQFTLPIDLFGLLMIMVMAKLKRKKSKTIKAI